MEELTPRQIEFLKNYNDPKSETFSNAKQSAIKAGYSEEYAKNLTGQFPDWLSENISRKKRIIEKAENNLEALLDEEDKRVKADMTKFALSRLKKEEYSEKTEMEHKGNINLNIDEQQALRIIRRRIGSNPSPITE
jgi:phage terminase small subunit